MSTVDQLEKRIQRLESQIKGLAAFAIETRALSDAHEALNANQVHGGEDAEDFPTREQLAAMSSAAADRLELISDRVAAMRTDDDRVM